MNYTAHGSQTSWADPSFTISNINSLQNDHEYPTVVGNCCLTNAFDTGTCFGEQSGGGVWIYPAMLKVTFATLGCEVTRVEADVVDWAGAGGAVVTLIDATGNVLHTASNTTTGGTEIIQVQSPSGPATAVGVTGYETEVLEFRLY